jgi:DNA-binding transcriptional ArsR family regulator
MRNYATNARLVRVNATAAGAPISSRLGDSDVDVLTVEHAELCKVLTDPKRLRLIDVLRHDERSVGELATQLGMTLPNVSQHLSVLRHQGLVSVRREGTTLYYRLSEPRIADACDIVHAIIADRLSPQRPLEDS